jgi:uncharacterized protein (DUF488 family)
LENTVIYTIGYSNRTLPEFLDELQQRRITHLVDVRSSPWSRNHLFNASQIERWSTKAGIMYRRAGDVLGGRSDITVDSPEYVSALEQIVSASSREPVAIMCAEGDPAQCHRTWDVGANLLLRWGIVATSVLRDGREEEIIATLRRVVPSRIRSEVRRALGGGPEHFSFE